MAPGLVLVFLGLTVEDRDVNVFTAACSVSSEFVNPAKLQMSQEEKYF